MATTSKQRLALAICDFLSKSIADGSVSADDKETIDVAINCIAESFHIDPNDAVAVSAAVGSQSLLQIYSAYESLKNASATASPLSTSAAEASASSSSSTVAPEPSEEDKKKAETLKSRGNASMANKDYATAIDLYSQALALDPKNAIFLSNRAAAHSAAKDHESARADAETAVAIDPHYTKAWSRLGLARFALGDAKGSMEAYQKGIEYEGNGGSEAMRKGFETAKRRVEELEGSSSPSAGARSGGAPGGSGGLPDLGSLASMLGGGGSAGGAGGASGMPDLSGIMSNPMFQSMAQNLMSNPEMMNSLMSNPRLRQMAEQFGSGGSLPDLGSMMSDPSIADLARNFMGNNDGAGRGAGN